MEKAAFARQVNLKFGIMESQMAKTPLFFLCRELIPGYLKGITGVYAPPSGYLVAPKEVEKFAKKQLGGIILWIT